jgi:hypothetical protein
VSDIKVRLGQVWRDPKGARFLTYGDEDGHASFISGQGLTSTGPTRNPGWTLELDAPGWKMNAADYPEGAVLAWTEGASHAVAIKDAQGFWVTADQTVSMIVEDATIDGIQMFDCVDVQVLRIGGGK